MIPRDQEPVAEDLSGFTEQPVEPAEQDLSAEVEDPEPQLEN